ncbi:MAG TPA: adenylate/guanylate cyclase domain-containing protein [Candidatus Saccharimonadales bacterium]|nr:adenylate/guanylate cyclase domain-containing protein [Candidatus Saccharimonadales bacterium]
METDSTTPAPAWLEATGVPPVPIRGTCSIGRSATNQVVLPDDKISRRHAMINTQSQGEHWLVDLGSANGTYVNGRRVSQPCRLRDGDTLEIGGFRFTFRLQQVSPARRQDHTTEKTIQDIRSFNCWLVVADLEDSTQVLQRLPAEQVPGYTGRWLAQCKQIVDDHRGVINKYLGDGFFAYWPERQDTAESVARALQALQEMQAAEDSPRFRFVVHHGKVVVGGQASLGEESLMGREVNFVFRMEKVAGGLGVTRLLSQSAHDLLQHVLPTTPHGRHPVPSFEGDYEFFTV